jgi:ATP-dependent DNA helicase RecG
MDALLRDVVGNGYKALEESFGLRTVGDLMRNYPRRYLERAQLTDLSTLSVGENVMVLAEVQRVDRKQSRDRRRRWLEVTIGDGRSSLKLTFFHKTQYFEKDLPVGARGLFTGQISLYRNIRQLTHPEYQLLEEDEDGEDFRETLVAVYPLKTGMKPWVVRRSVEAALRVLDPP